MIFEKVKKILSEQFDVEEETITIDTSFTDDLNADSLELVDLIMDVEDVFEIEVEDDDAKGISTVGDLVKYIEDKI